MKKKEFSFSGKSIQVPGDKSLSHRFVLFSALSRGVSECHGFLEAEDPLHTLECFGKMGIVYEKWGEGRFKITSPGKEGLTSPKEILDFGNAGTGIRLSCGLIAGLEGREAILTGDASLQKRPMGRIVDPLNQLGANVKSQNEDGKAPLHVLGKKINSGFYESPLASAQVKSCLLFAAMSSEVGLEYKEPELSRDHTENMIRFLGGKLEYISPIHFRLHPPYNFEGTTFRIPGDISSAAFFIVLGLLAKKDSLLKIENVGLNPSRSGIIEILRDMGGRIEIKNPRKECGEDTGDIWVYGSDLHKVDIKEALIPSIIDEIPVLSIAGLFAKGGFSIRHAEDLRAKESDRIHSMVTNIRKLGIDVKEYKDGYEFVNPRKELSTTEKIESFMDHRIAMSFSILKYATGENWEIDDVSWVETSFPGFFSKLESLK